MATKITTADIETYLEGLGKQDSKGKILFQRILFNIKTLKSGVKIVLDSPDTEPVLKNFKSQMIKTLMTKFKGGKLIKVQQKLTGINKKIDQEVIRLKYSENGNGTKYIDFDVREYPVKGKSGALNAKISEPATRLIFNAALETKGKVFKTEEDIFVHDVYKDLEKLFGKENGHKLDEWIYTFLQQNILFFKNYGRYTWAKFKHQDSGQRDMQVFFKEHLKTLESAPGVTRRNYTQWNPADIYAVKRSEQGTLETEIKEASKSPNANTLMKLNNHMVKLMEKKELVGISLKKIKSGDTPHFKLYNVDDSKLLSNLKAFTALETFKMDDIYFELRNVLANFPGTKAASQSSPLTKVPAATTYFWFGNSNKNASQFLVSITRADTQLGWEVSVPSSSGAKAGQAPVAMVKKLLSKDASGLSFDNNFKDYPKTADDFADIIGDSKSTEYKLYKKWFDFVNTHPKNTFKGAKNFKEWGDGILEAYEAREKAGMGIAGVTKLALLNFWFDALKNHDKDPEFWTDILYFGMKITTKGQFGPHAKIS
tara:strand:- start:86 stop:1705 length:1620 start_codon:yes stop_codon:yes gene_type:complete